jgi:hypothetical protein
MTNENVRNEVGGRPWSKNKDLKTGTDRMPDKRELPVDDMQAKNSKNAQEEEMCYEIKRNEKFKHRTQRVESKRTKG